MGSVLGMPTRCDRLSFEAVTLKAAEGILTAAAVHEGQGLYLGAREIVSFPGARPRSDLALVGSWATGVCLCCAAGLPRPSAISSMPTTTTATIPCLLEHWAVRRSRIATVCAGYSTP